MNASLQPQHLAALAVALAASGFDLRTRRIPNALTFGAAAAALGYAMATHGVSGLLTSAGGWFTGCALFLPFFALGGLGAGDVKLAAAVGAWIAPRDAFWMSMYTMVAGGVLAILVSLATGYLKHAIANVSLLLTHWRIAGISPLSELTLSQARGTRLPYALPIAVGTAGALLWH
ncbi:MAG: prepilin peptidase [Vicinamibacterales bacterium]